MADHSTEDSFEHYDDWSPEEQYARLYCPQEMRVPIGRVYDENRTLTAERDSLTAQNAVLREALQDFYGDAVNGDMFAGGLPYKRLEPFRQALADPAPRAADLLALVEAAQEVVTVADQERFSSENRYNAPGHAHLTPPYWDMGEECERCRAWMTLLDALARLDGEGE